MKKFGEDTPDRAGAAVLHQEAREALQARPFLRQDDTLRTLGTPGVASSRSVLDGLGKCLTMSPKKKPACSTVGKREKLKRSGDSTMPTGSGRIFDSPSQFEY